MGPSQESTTESDSSAAIKPIKWANVALRFAKTPNPSQQYQHLTSAEPVLLFKSGLRRSTIQGDPRPPRRTCWTTAVAPTTNTLRKASSPALVMTPSLTLPAVE